MKIQQHDGVVVDAGRHSSRASPSTQRRRRGVGEGRAAPWRVVRLPSPHPSIYRGKGEGGRPP